MSPVPNRAGEFPLRGHPGVPDGLVAYAQPTHDDGTFDTDRDGRPRVRRVQLRTDAEVAHPERPDGPLTDADWRWATSATRRWTTIRARFGEQADDIALALARAGCVALDCDYRSGRISSPWRGWTPHPSLAGEQASAEAARRDRQSQVAARAAVLSSQLAAQWPGVASALATPDSDPRLEWMVRAAEDLAQGRSHDSARAFVQAHVFTTKAREDLPRLLAEAGFEPDALTHLGISRNPYVGLGGPIRAHLAGRAQDSGRTHLAGRTLDSGRTHLAGRTLDFSGWPGPHDIRLPAGQPITLDIVPGTRILLVIENRQAAEAICDHHPEIAVIWCHGQPPDAVLRLTKQAASCVDQVLICPDADLGGIRIAARVHDHLVPGARCTVLDIGTAEHTAGDVFSPGSREIIARMAQRHDGVGDLASACLRRGYAIEQEAPIRAALRRLLERNS
jgi:hypothetical protein